MSIKHWLNVESLKKDSDDHETLTLGDNVEHFRLNRNKSDQKPGSRPRTQRVQQVEKGFERKKSRQRRLTDFLDRNSNLDISTGSS